MTASGKPEPAVQPEDLGRYFLERANAGDVEGLVAWGKRVAALGRMGA
jgi:hypothetical protein